MTSREHHWERVYQDRGPINVSWYQEHASRSLDLIAATRVDLDASIIDIGGGASPLVDGLIDLGYSAITVLDLSATALAYARERLGGVADDVAWIEADITEHHFDGGFDVWHDRAVFHFLTDPTDRAKYVDTLRSAVPHGGHVIVATFNLGGPRECSGLPVERYDAHTLHEALGVDFEPVRFENEAHHTPTGATQHFLYGHFRRIRT